MWEKTDVAGPQWVEGIGVDSGNQVDPVLMQERGSWLGLQWGQEDGEKFMGVGDKRWNPQYRMMGLCGKWGRESVKDDFLNPHLGNRWMAVPHNEMGAPKSHFSSHAIHTSPCPILSRASVQALCSTVYRGCSKSINFNTSRAKLIFNYSALLKLLSYEERSHPLANYTSQKQGATFSFLLSPMGNGQILRILPPS